MREFTYLERELSERSNKKSIYNAFQRGDLTIVVSAGVYWFERVPDRILNTVQAEIKRLYPELKYLYSV